MRGPINMDDMNNTADNLLNVLREREKELNCLYKVDSILGNHHLTLAEMLEGIVQVLPAGYRFPGICHSRIFYKNSCYQTSGFVASPIAETCPIKVDGSIVGTIEIVYTQNVPKAEEGYFLESENMLIRAVADRIAQMLIYRRMKSVMNEWETAKERQPSDENKHEWEVIIDFLRQNDHALLRHVCRKLTNHLLINGVIEASRVFTSVTPERQDDNGYVNYPSASGPIDNIINISCKAFELASRNMSGTEITALVKRWIQEEKSYSLVKAIGSIAPSLRNIIEEIRKLQNLSDMNELQYTPKERWINVGLIRRFLSDRADFINIAKQYLNTRDFFDIINRIIYPIGSQGRLGGKGAGLFLAQKILENEAGNLPRYVSVKYPKTWYIATDTITEFLRYNNLEELNEQKYGDLQEIRIEYPNIIHLLKSAKMPPEIVSSLSAALDDFSDNPLIVRSSSTLEDQAGAAFSGKYKSLFLANQGTKKEKLDALINAILEIYASVFSPDPIQYRAERDLLDVHEEMGILIQEVVGKRAGKYFFPLFSGVAFSNNEYRWSPRIEREDGLIRLVPGLGTRAVDRVGDDFPVMISPGKPGIKVNIVPEEIRRYSPKMMDVIDLESNTFRTVNVADLLRECGDEIENVHRIVSIFEYDHIRKPNRLEINYKKDDLVVTFDGIISDTSFTKQISVILKTLAEKMGMPVDIEFACDGNDIYLLQCRPQSYSRESSPASIPKDIADRDKIFSANKFITNGLIQNISHIVYVDSEGYDRLTELDDLKTTGKIVGMLNSILPRRQFILIGPGRWGSRGDIKLGVPVTYSDICNTAALIEVAVKKMGYIPELSFGTHFFQDLVEADIRFLPLYPDEKDTIFNRRFLARSPNKLSEILPEYSRFEDTIRVINVPEVSDGRMLSIAMNADLGEAIGYLAAHVVELPKPMEPIEFDDHHGDEHSWRWRSYMAEQLAASIDPISFGVKAIYLFGSVNNGTAGPNSDIDLIIHFCGTPAQRASLETWLSGWSLSLSEINYLKTGYRMNGMLDVHIITDEDIKMKTAFAVKIDNVTEPARKLELKNVSPQ
jgi:pyruvate,water dikinase